MKLFLAAVLALTLAACAPDAPVEPVGLLRPEARWMATPKPLPLLEPGLAANPETQDYIARSRAQCAGDRRTVLALQDYIRTALAAK